MIRQLKEIQMAKNIKGCLIVKCKKHFSTVRQVKFIKLSKITIWHRCGNS